MRGFGEGRGGGGGSSAANGLGGGNGCGDEEHGRSAAGELTGDQWMTGEAARGCGEAYGGGGAVRGGAEQGTPRRGRAAVELRWSLGRSCAGRSGWRRKGSFYSAGRSEAARRGQRARATWLGGAGEQLARGGLAATPLAGRASSRGQGFSMHWVGQIAGV